MANVLSFSVTEAADRFSLDIKETSGVYSGSNTGGWGAPNSDIADAETATIEITLPGASVALTPIDAYPTLPNTTSVVFTIANTDLGLTATTELPVGIYTIKYLVTRTTATAFSYEVTCYVLIDGQLSRCLDRMIAAMSIEDCECGGEAGNFTNSKVTQLRNLLQGARDNACCSKIDKSRAVVDYIKDICDCFFD